MDDTPRRPANEPLVPLIPESDFSPEMMAVAAKNLKRMGRVANSARAFANAGDLGALTRKFFDDSWSCGTFPLQFRLLVRYVVANANACHYCQTHQIDLLQKAGVDEEKLANALAFETHPAFDERERAAMAFARAQTEDAANIPEDVVDRFVAAFTPAERTEIAIIAATMDMLNKVNDSLRIPLEGQELVS